MRAFIKSFIVSLFAFVVFAGTAVAQVYPVTTPTYIPNATKASQTFTAPGDYTFINNGTGTVTLEVRGTCTALEATVQATVDGTTWTGVDIYPVVTGTVTAASAVSAAGLWGSDSAAFQALRLHITALTASCAVSMIGAPVGFTNLF